MREQMLANPHGAERFGERSYAIISDKYLNFSSRVGYHYSVLDAYCGQSINKNYITFSFKGGPPTTCAAIAAPAPLPWCSWPPIFPWMSKEIAWTPGFRSIHNRTSKRNWRSWPVADLHRQMDMLMTTEASVELVAKNFLEGNYNYD